MNELQTFGQFRPTQFDAAGVGSTEDNADWIVLPVGQTRDSDALARSNFRVVVADAEREGIDVVVHRFGHWGPGWFEIAIVPPSALEFAQSWADALANYPVADDGDFSELEAEETQESWEAWGRHDVVRQITNEIERTIEPSAEIDAYAETMAELIRAYMTRNKGEDGDLTWIRDRETPLHIAVVALSYVGAYRRRSADPRRSASSVKRRVARIVKRAEKQIWG